MELVLDDEEDLDASLLVRTNFSDDGAWEALVAAANAAYGPDGFAARFVAVSDIAFDGMSPEQLAQVPGSALTVYAADAAAMSGPETSLLVVDRDEEPGRFFRVLVSEAWGPENNLRLGNMGFSEFATSVDSGGVFRGFA
jgi:hypothetical protein